jgi:hypothetical protein
MYIGKYLYLFLHMTNAYVILLLHLVCFSYPMLVIKTTHVSYTKEKIYPRNEKDEKYTYD